MSEALAEGRWQRKRRLATDDELRDAITAALARGDLPKRIADRLGVTCQRVWNIRTAIERRATRPGGCQSGVRVCLACAGEFMSWGPGNRRCLTCSKTADHAGPYEASFGGHVRIRLR